MEDENSVFGFDADNTNKLDSEEKFSIYHNKEEAKNNIDISSKELSDFVDSLIQDVPAPTDEEVNAGIEKILERTHPQEPKNKASNIKKVTFRVLFIAALLSAVFISCIFVVGSNHNINMENGFVTFAKDAVKIVFFGADKEEHIDVKTLMEDLESHNYKNIILPQALYKYKSSLPVYSKSVKGESSNDRVEFQLSKDTSSYLFKIEKVNSERLEGNYFLGLENAKTVIVDDLCIYVLEFENGLSYIRFVNEEYEYLIQSDVLLSEMMNTAQTIIKMEE